MELRYKVMSALRWTASARLLGQLFSWLVTIAVIRILSPADYGLMAMSVVLVSFLVLLNTLGLDAVLVQDRTLQQRDRQQIFGFIIAVNMACFLLLFGAAGPVAGFYGEPAVKPVLQALSFQFLLLIFETLPQSQLEREIDFSRRSVVDLLTLVAGSLTMLALALSGFGVWALVWSTLVNTALRMLGLNLICRCQVWPRFSWRGMRRHLAFGSHVSTDRSFWYIYSESDKFIGGKLLGGQALGYYSVAHQLASLPIQKVSGLLNSVAFPAFSRAHAESSNEQVRGYLLTATRLLSLAAFPLFLGIAATARPLVELVLGEQWLPAVPLLQILGLVMPFRLLSNVFPPLLWGMGVPRVSAQNFLLAALLMPLAFVIGASWGVVGLALAWLCAYPLVFLLLAWRTCRAANLGLLQYALQLWRPLLASLLMSALVSLLGASLFRDGAGWTDLGLLVATGVASYAALVWLLDRRGALELVSLLRG